MHKKKVYRLRFLSHSACKCYCEILFLFFLVGCYTNNKLTADVTPTTFRKVEVSKAMGENPDYEDYIGGDPCEECEDILFNGKTPKYVLASFSNIVPCPLGSAIDYNKAFLLTQSAITPCLWRFDTGGAFVVLQFDFGSDLTIIEHAGLPKWIFIDISDAECHDEYVNQNLICGGLIGAIGGTGIISWGPSIHP